jgi:ABC-type nitrate/sulfonate/bicarbonate transport system substrate-binding protein
MQLARVGFFNLKTEMTRMRNQSTPRSRPRARAFTWGVAVLAVALVATGCSSSKGSSAAGSTAGSAAATPTSTTPEKTNLTVTYGTNSPSTTPLWLAVDEGIFAKHGLNVKAVQATSNVGALAVISGGADIYVGEATTTFQAIASGSPVEMVGNLRILNDFKLYVSPSITDVSQLKGKSLAISAAGDSTDLSSRIALEELHSSTDGITLLPTGTSAARLATLISGKVAGTLLTEPTATAAKKAGMKLLLDQTTEPFTGSGITITKSFGQSNPNTVNAFLESLVEGVKYLQDPANKQTVLSEIAKYTQSTPDATATVNGYATYTAPGALVMDPTPNVAAGQAILDGLKSEDSSRFGSLTLDKVFNTTFTARLKSSGFLQATWGSALNSSAAASSTSSS